MADLDQVDRVLLCGMTALGSSFQNCYRISLEKGECGRNVFTRVVNNTYDVKVSKTSGSPN